MANLLYNENQIIGKLFRYFSIYFYTFPAPTAESLFLLVLAMLAMESADSIRSLHRRFLAGITEKSLNAFYYACSYAKVDYSCFMNTTARIALRLIPAGLESQPLFLCVDDTMVSKFGKKFEDVSKLFDHAAHNGCSYLNGHCFVSLMLCVPVWSGRKISYLAVPLGYRLWKKEESKLALAASMVRQTMPEFSGRGSVIILCDSWYVKKDIISLVDEYENLDLIGNARSDSVIYDLAPAPTGKKGRPAKRGRRLSIDEDFVLSDEKAGDYYTGCRRVLTNVFGTRQVMAYVTSANQKKDQRRLFFSTVFPTQLQIFCAWQEKSPLNQVGSDRMQYIPLLLYSFRWGIEVSYYEQKAFWSLCGYMLRSRKGIEMLVNLINISYCATKLIPYMEETLSGYRHMGPQDFRFALSGQIRRQIFYVNLAQNIETHIKSKRLVKVLKQLCLRQVA